MDWQDSLKSLRDSMPGGDVPPAHDDDDTAAAVSSDKPVQTAPLIISIERKGRAGKTATIVHGFTIGDEDVARVAASLKKSLGTGGSSRGGEILIQGDRREDVRRALAALGYKSRM